MLESKVLQEQNLEEECPHAAHLGLLLDEDLKVLVDDGHSQQDSGSGSKQIKGWVYVLNKLLINIKNIWKSRCNNEET